MESTVENNGPRFKTIVLRNSCGYSAEVLKSKPQVISWKDQRGEDLLFRIFFGQLFDSNTEFEQLGFWTTDPFPHSTTPSDRESIDFLFKIPRADYPHRFDFRLRITLENNGDLTMKSTIKNRGGDFFVFKLAYHNYISVSDISEVQIKGLKTCNYMDYTLTEYLTEESDEITVNSEVDRAYHHTDPRSTTQVIDRRRERTYTIHGHGLHDVVFWNPWDEKAHILDDFGDLEYREMLCLGAAAATQGVVLRPGQEWVGTQRLSVHPVNLVGI